MWIWSQLYNTYIYIFIFFFLYVCVCVRVLQSQYLVPYLLGGEGVETVSGPSVVPMSGPSLLVVHFAYFVVCAKSQKVLRGAKIVSLEIVWICEMRFLSIWCASIGLLCLCSEARREWDTKTKQTKIKLWFLSEGPKKTTKKDPRRTCKTQFLFEVRGSENDILVTTICFGKIYVYGFCREKKANTIIKWLQWAEGKTKNPTAFEKWVFWNGCREGFHNLWYAKAVFCWYFRNHCICSVISKTQQLQKKGCKPHQNSKFIKFVGSVWTCKMVFLV